jgi:pimeloyl-ACP methyl ester carboxylesterase
MSGAAAAGSALTDMPVAALARLAGAAAVESALLRGFVMLGGDPAVATDTAAAGLRLAARGESIAELRRFPLRETIERIRCPITFVNGARDVPIVWFDRYYAGCAQRGRAVRVARTPHGVMVLRPCSVAHEIEAFVWDLVSE